MNNILKAEFKKIFKGKLIYVVLFATIAFSLLMIFLNKMIMNMFNGMFISVDTYSSMFAPLSNVGLFILIFVIVIGTKDFTNRTIRTKLVGGYSRDQVYLASLIKTFIIVIISFTCYALSTYLFSTILNVSTIKFIDFFKTYIIGMTSSLVFYSIINLITFKFSTFGKTLGFSLILLFSITIISSFISLSTSSLLVEIFDYALPIAKLGSINVSNISNFFISLGVNLGYIILINILAVFINRKIDYN